MRLRTPTCTRGEIEMLSYYASVKAQEQSIINNNKNLCHSNFHIMYRSLSNLRSVKRPLWDGRRVLRMKMLVILCG